MKFPCHASRDGVSRNDVAFSLIARAKINEGTSETMAGSNNNTCQQSRFLPTCFLHGGYLLLVHYTPREVQGSASTSVCVGREGERTQARTGQVSLKNRVAIPVSTWRKMKRAFHAPTLFSRFLVINSSASHYGEFPRERTQHKLQISTAGLRYGRLNFMFLSKVFHTNEHSHISII